MRELATLGDELTAGHSQRPVLIQAWAGLKKGIDRQISLRPSCHLLALAFQEMIRFY